MMRRSPMKRGTSTLARTTFKKRSPKKRAGHDANVRNACRGHRCYLRVPGVCLGASGIDTVVPCHANWGAYGKGMGIKADDKFTVPGCIACHSWLDQGCTADKHAKRATWEAAYAAWAPVRDGAGP